jgi:hypothetical protein
MSKTSYFYYVFFLFSYFFSSCNSQEIDHITIASFDNTDSIRLEVGLNKIFKNCSLDTTKINDDIANHVIDVFNIENYVVSSPDSSLVFYATNKKKKIEGELSVHILGIINEEIKKLYYIEVEQGKWFWRLSEKNNNVIDIIDDRIIIDTSLQSIGFALSGLIKFPLNKEGLYSREKRFLNLKANFLTDK